MTDGAGAAPPPTPCSPSGSSGRPSGWPSVHGNPAQNTGRSDVEEQQGKNLLRSLYVLLSREQPVERPSIAGGQ